MLKYKLSLLIIAAFILITSVNSLTDGNADAMGIEIRKPDGIQYFKDPSGGGSRALTKGDFSIVRE
jgi:hypothetical protein